MQILLPMLMVGLGSMIGGVSRYGMSLLTQNVSAFSLPYGTLLSNLAGCLLIGVIAGFGDRTELLSTEMPDLEVFQGRGQETAVAAIRQLQKSIYSNR